VQRLLRGLGLIVLVFCVAGVGTLASAQDEGFAVESFLNFEDLKGAVDKLDFRPGFLYFDAIDDGVFRTTTGVTLLDLSFKETEYVTFGGGYGTPDVGYVGAGIHIKPVLESIPYIRVTNTLLENIPGDPSLQFEVGHGWELKDGGEAGWGYGASISINF